MNYRKKVVLSKGRTVASQTKQIIDDMPKPFRIGFIALTILASLLIVYLFVKWAFLDKPNPYEWHYEKAPAALEADLAATELNNPHNAANEDIVTQIRNNQGGVVDGVKLQPSDNNSTVQAETRVKQSIQAVEQNNRLVANAGGIATLEQVQQTYNGNPEDPEQAKKVQRVLQQAGVATGTNVNEGLSDAQLGAAAFTSY